MPQDDSNGRVTNAILATKLDALTEMVRRQIDDGDKRDSRIALLETCEAVNRQKWQNHGDLHKRERGLLGTISLIGNVIAGTIGVLIDK